MQKYAEVEGFQSLAMTGSEPTLGLAQFAFPASAMKFIRSQKRHQGLQDANLWAAKNRSRAERCRSKVVSKLKKHLIELGGFSPANINCSR